jgi:hypothetical protein
MRNASVGPALGRGSGEDASSAAARERLAPQDRAAQVARNVLENLARLALADGAKRGASADVALLGDKALQTRAKAQGAQEKVTEGVMSERRPQFRPRWNGGPIRRLSSDHARTSVGHSFVPRP